MKPKEDSGSQLRTVIGSVAGGGSALVLYLLYVAPSLPEAWFKSYGAGGTIATLVAGIGTATAGWAISVLDARLRRRRSARLEALEQAADDAATEVDVFLKRVEVLANGLGRHLPGLPAQFQRLKSVPPDLPDELTWREGEAVRAARACLAAKGILSQQYEIFAAQLRSTSSPVSVVSLEAEPAFSSDLTKRLRRLDLLWP